MTYLEVQLKSCLPVALKPPGAGVQGVWGLRNQAAGYDHSGDSGRVDSANAEAGARDGVRMEW